MIRTAALIIGLSLLGASTPSLAANQRAERGEQELTKILGDRIAGKPISCLNLQDIRSSRVLDGTAIVYEGPGNRLYVNRPTTGAQSLRSDDILVVKSWGGQLCNIDTVTLLDRGSRFQRGFVGLGNFVPYTRDQPKR